MHMILSNLYMHNHSTVMHSDLKVLSSIIAALLWWIAFFIDKTCYDLDIIVAKYFLTDDNDRWGFRRQSWIPGLHSYHNYDKIISEVD